MNRRKESFVEQEIVAFFCGTMFTPIRRNQPYFIEFPLAKNAENRHYSGTVIDPLSSFPENLCPAQARPNVLQRPTKIGLSSTSLNPAIESKFCTR
jgi:hypothetical protein